MFDVGNVVRDIRNGSNVQILEKIEVWGYISYKVYDASEGTVYKIAADQLKSNQDTTVFDESYLRYVSLLAKIKNETAGGILSSLSSGIIPLPHQLHVLNRAMETNQIRYILADEVGLGKTIEAGMIIKELKTRGLIRRILVVCPTGLVTQWATEMQEKFHERYQIILPSDYDTIRRLTDSKDVYGQYDQVISPMDSIKPLEKHTGWTSERVEEYNAERIYSVINSGWDLIVIDEAHRVAGSSGEVARHKLGRLLADASPYLLLLTATPHNGKTEPFLRLIRLLDDEAFPNAQSVVKEQVAPYLIRTEKREAIDNSGNLLFKKRVTHLESLTWDERHTMQRHLYELVSEYVAKTYDKAKRNRKKNMCLIFLLIIMQRMVTSSTAAIRQSLERRLKVLLDQETHTGTLAETDLDEINIENGVSDATEAVSLDSSEEIEALEQMINVAKQAELQYTDAKVELLVSLLENIFLEDQNQKVIIFTEFMATQLYLEALLLKKEYQVTLLNGGMSMEERDQALREFRSSSNVFISTDAGGEGLNLQFSNIIINYDLPWNPMKIEQRCGRVDRIGQQRDVQIYNFIIEDTVESRVREVLEQKLEVILEEIGVDKYSDVLDGEMAELDFTDVYLRSINKPHKVEENLYPVESDMKQQLENTRKYKEVIHEEKDLTALVGQSNDFDVDAALRLMLMNYRDWKGLPRELIDRISITDDEITKHLRADIVQDRSSGVMEIAIDDFPNEAGYFMLWNMSLSNEEEEKRVIPIFVNDSYALRPMAGKKLLEVFLDANSGLRVSNTDMLATDTYLTLDKMSREYAYDTFVEMRNKKVQKNKERFEKYMYALKLRKEAAEHIGIENIRVVKLEKIEEEQKEMEQSYQSGDQIYPDFKLMFLARLVA